MRLAGTKAISGSWRVQVGSNSLNAYAFSGNVRNNLGSTFERFFRSRIYFHVIVIVNQVTN